ncbi:MAG: homoserine dehydrogenase [Pseudomonadales bacterium]|nr:homoserine dehydrogenase [Pseudomonadales bacterium]MBL6813798.1 homoserine dehydrogenase [Pseudomonadales bacterium]
MIEIKLGIAGLGTVAQGVLELIRRNNALMRQRSGISLRVVRVASRRAKPEIDLQGAHFSTDIEDLLTDPNVDMILELIGGDTTALDLIRRSLTAYKPVVTANKAILAAHGNELMAGRGRQLLRFEAAVAGAIPIIQGLTGGLAANRLAGLFGIINGTCNYIFGEMEANGTAFDEVLAEAQRLGYAEADPSFDIDGIDAAHKLTILLALGFTGSYDLSAVFVEGIRHVTVADIRFARELGFKIKHLGIIQNTDAGVEARVHCALVPGDALLANVNGVMNAVQINSDGAGETLFSGPGAGGEATASAVLSDVLALGALMASGNGIGVPSESDQSSERLSDQPALVSMSDVSCANYLRIPTVDQPGVFAQVTQALSEFSISIDAAIQHEASSKQSAVDIVLLTNNAVESTMNAALEQLQRLDIVAADIVRLRVAPTL